MGVNILDKFMKSLIILPIIFLLAGCNLGQSEEEKLHEEENMRVNSILDKSKEAFESNRDFMLAEIIFGTLCLRDVEKTGKVEGPDCETYHIAQELADESTETGILILIALFKEGYLTIDSPRFPEFENIVQQLIVLSEEAYAIRTDLEGYGGSNCKKCTM